jgi:hypothetical protein
MDPMFTLLWQQYRTWADTARHLKERNAGWKRKVLTLTIAGTALATLGPHSSNALVARVLPMIGAAALAVATYFGKELLDAGHEERWTRARAAAEAFKSEACKYLVKVPPYDSVDRVAKLKMRLDELAKVIVKGQPDDISDDQSKKDLPTQEWTFDDYLVKRLDDQVTFYRNKAMEHTARMNRGRIVSLTLGCTSVLLGAVTGATPEGATLSGAVLGVVTTAGGALGAYFQAGHYEAIAVKYRETALALSALKAEFTSPGATQDAAGLVTSAEAIMQAENVGWLTEITTVKT